MPARSYTDEALASAVARSHSWRGVLRLSGLRGTSAGSLRAVRRRAERLGLSSTHFTGQRRWSDSALAAAVEGARSWAQVATVLDLSPSGTTVDSLRSHALRLGLSTEHLARRTPQPRSRIVPRYEPSFLRDAGSLLAATWFTLRGARVSWPLEPCRYDLLVDQDGSLSRVQVKTTVTTGPAASVMISNSRRVGRAVYVPDEIDCYFLVDGELTAYLIPYDVVAGFGRLQLTTYAGFVVARRGDLLSEASSPAPAPRSRSASR